MSKGVARPVVRDDGAWYASMTEAARALADEAFASFESCIPAISRVCNGVPEFTPTIKCDFCGAPVDERKWLFESRDRMSHVCEQCVDAMTQMLGALREDEDDGE